MGNLVIASGETRLITANGSATIYNSSVDMSGFIGCKITVADGSGNELVAYGHGADDAGALDSNAITATINYIPPYDFSTFTLNANGYDLDACISDGASRDVCYTNDVAMNGYLWKITKTFTLNSGTAPSLKTTRDTIIPSQTIEDPITSTDKYWTGCPHPSYPDRIDDGICVDTKTTAACNFSLAYTMQKVTSLGTDALQLRDQDAESGSSRNATSIDVGFDPNNVATITVEPMVSGATSGITSNQATLTATVVGADTDQPVGLGFYDASDDSLLNTITELTGLSDKVHLATKDGEAMLFVDDVDLSSYAGTDSGSTPNMMILEDSSGNICASYIGAIGGGESLGSELITGWTNSVSNPFETITVNVNGRDFDSAINTTGSGRADCGDIVTAGSLYKSVVATTINSGGSYNYSLGVGAGGSFSAGQLLKTISATGVDTVIFAPKTYTVVGVYAGAAINFSATFTLKKYSDIPATGVHLVSEPDGSTRNVAYKDTNFNPNAVVTIKIFNRFTHGDDSDTFDWTGLSPATSYSWYPKADNGVQIVTGDTVNFDTNTKPYASNLSPADGETVTETYAPLSATFNDDEGGSGSLRFYNAEDDSLIGTASSVADGATGQIEWSGLTPGQEYQFYVIPNDGVEDGAASATITFKVAALGRGFSPFYSPFGSPFNSPFQNM
jgi:hypothetical protein